MLDAVGVGPLRRNKRDIGLAAFQTWKKFAAAQHDMRDVRRQATVE